MFNLIIYLKLELLLELLYSEKKNPVQKDYSMFF